MKKEDAENFLNKFDSEHSNVSIVFKMLCEQFDNDTSYMNREENRHKPVDEFAHTLESWAITFQCFREIAHDYIEHVVHDAIEYEVWKEEAIKA